MAQAPAAATDPDTVRSKTARLLTTTPLLFGEPAPRLEGKTLTGETVRLAELSGRVVLVDFWGSWCKPCLADIPKLRRLQARFGDKAFTLLGVNSDKDPETLRRFLAENRMGWTNVFDGRTERPIARAWGVEAWPATFLVDAKGIIRGQDLTFEKLEWQIAEMLKKN